MPDEIPLVDEAIVEPALVPNDPVKLPPLTYGGRLLTDLTDDELWAAIISVGEMYNFRFDKLNDPRITRKGHRLNKIFNANPPEENETYTKLVNELQSEWKSRNENV